MITILTRCEETPMMGTRTVHIRESEIRQVSVIRTEKEGIIRVIVSGYNDLCEEAADPIEAKRLYAQLTSKGGLLEGV